MSATLSGTRYGTVPPAWDNGPGDHGGCGFPEGKGDPDRMCPEIPVATIDQVCSCGHIDLLPACTGHADEAAAHKDFIGHPDSPGVLTCPMCRDGEEPHACRVFLAVTWDDMRPAAVIQQR